MTKRELVDIQEPNCFSTWCNNCKVVCHYPCDIHEGNLIQKSSWWCSAMTWFNRQFSVHCTVCPKECPWRDHEQIKKKQIFETYMVTQTVDALRHDYMNDQKEKFEKAKANCDRKMVATYDKVLEDFREIQQHIAFINKYSLSSKPTGITEYIKHVIRIEEKTKEDGYKQRIYCLNKLVEMKDEDTPEDKVQQAIHFVQRIINKDD